MGNSTLPLPLSHRQTLQLRAAIAETVRAFAQERGLDLARVEFDAAFIFANLAASVTGAEYREWLHDHSESQDQPAVGASAESSAASGVERVEVDQPRERGRSGSL